MITIIHGDDIKSSRNYFSSLKQKAGPSLTLEGATLDITTLTQSLSGDGLFEENNTVFIEQLLSKRKKSKELDSLLAAITTSDKDIIMWENKELDRKSLTAFPKAVVKAFKLPQAMFAFLDNLRPNNGSQLIKLYHQVLETVEPEILFAMMVRQLRLLLAVGSKVDDPIEEIKRLAPWQEQKLKKQRSLFTDDQLIDLYNQLFELDYRQKTGRLSMPATSAIDILLLKL